MSTDPLVALVPDREHQPGLDRMEDLRPSVMLDCAPLSVALATRYDCDMHFVMYHVVDEDGELNYLRVNKTGPAPDQIVEGGGRIELTVVALDYDCETAEGKHRPWRDRAEVDEFLARLAGLAIPEPSAFYVTRQGARFVYALSRPVSPIEGEALIAGLQRDYLAAGIKTDPRCRDWTRLFRLPCVVRENGPSWDMPTHELATSDAVLDPGSIEPGDAGAREARAPVDVDLGDLPSPEDCRLMLETPEGLKTEWCKVARRYLRGRDAFPILFESAPVTWRPGERNDSLMRAIASCVGLLYHRPGATPARIYALFHGVIEQLEPDAGTPDWRLAAWGMIGRFWRSEAGKAAAVEVEVVQREGEAVDIRGKIILSLREEYSHEPALEDPDQAIAWMDRRLIAAAPKGYFVMRPDGSYSPVQVGKDRLVPMIRHLGMEALIPTSELRDGVWKSKDAQEIINAHAVPVRRVECSPRVKCAYVRGEDSSATLMLKVHELRDMPGEYDEMVAHWLKLLGGADHQALLEWLSHSIDPTWGICALVLVGASGTGKGMLAQAIAENFRYGRFNDGRVLGRFNAGLLESPVVVLDEGLPASSQDGRRVDEVIRSLTVGGNIAIEPKGLDVIQATIFPRLVITSNNWDVIQQICGSRDLSHEDALALETRLLVVNVSDDARRWLTANGNYSLTKGWVEGSVASTFRVAKHIRWLYENRRPVGTGSGRLLVEGRRQTELMREMSMKTASAQATLRALIALIEDPAPNPGFHVDPAKRAWVVPHGIVSFYERNLMQRMRMELSNKAVAKVLRKIARGEPTTATRLPGQGDAVDKQRWWELDLQVLMYEAVSSGQPRERLRALFAAQNGEEALAMLEASFDRERAHA